MSQIGEVDDVILQGKPDDACDITGPDPFGDVTAVLFYGPFREEYDAADLFGRLLLADEPDDLDLFGGKAGVGHDEPGVFVFWEDAVDDMIAGFLAEIFLSIQESGHGPDEFFVVFAF